MRVVRSRAFLSAAFALWCQVFVLGTPIAQHVVAAMQDEHAEIECLCEKAGGHSGAMCPMHHSPAKKKSESSDARCRVSQTDTSLSALMLTTGAPPEPPLQFATPIDHSVAVVLSADRLLSRSTSLDPPPPRS